MEIFRFTGSLLGTAIGDSLGAKREGSFDISENREIGPRYTDDTAMMIGVAESLINCKGFNGEDMAERFVQNFFREPWRGYGLGPPRIFNMIHRDKKRWNEMLDRELYPGGSFGNGSAMRVAPLGLLYSDDPERLRDVVQKASMITHSHELAIEGAVIQAYAVALAVNTKPYQLNREKFIKRLIEFTRNRDYLDKLKILERFLKMGATKRDVINHLGNGIEALNSVPTALYSFLSNNDFEESLVYAVSLGGDADTIGAMTGAIAGAYYGIEKIPLRWIERAENKQYLIDLGEKLWERKRTGYF